MNVLLIMCDSLAPHDLGCYGDKCALTPNIDRLAESGVTFDRAYCNSPLCAPSRASLVTGRYCSELNAFDNANEFRADVPTVAHALRRAGYETTICGKMHFLGHDQSHGFDRRLALEKDYSQRYSPEHFKLAYDWDEPGRNPVGENWMAETYAKDARWDSYTFHYDCDREIHRTALAFLSGKDANSGPFFCCVSYHVPHNPFWAPETDKRPFLGKRLPLPTRKNVRHGVMDDWLNDFHYMVDHREEILPDGNLQWLYETYYGMVHYLDGFVGELLDALDRQGLRENTMVAFTSDHGDMMGHRGLVQKRNFYERSARVPLIFSLPHHCRRGARSNELVSLVDLVPTFAELAGDPCHEVRGDSLVPAIASGAALGDRTIFCEYHGEGVHAPCFMARRGDYKYIYVHGHEELLYNVTEDPEELNVLPCQGPGKAVASALRKALLAQFDPDRIARAARQSQRDRAFILDAWRRGTRLSHGS